VAHFIWSQRPNVIVGSPNIQAGQTLKLFGFWHEHPKFGSQFTVAIPEAKQQHSQGWKYLGSKQSRELDCHRQTDCGILVERHSTSTIQIQAPIRVPGVPKSRVKMIPDCLGNTESYQRSDVVSPESRCSTYASKSTSNYGDKAIEIVTVAPTS